MANISIIRATIDIEKAGAISRFGENNFL